MKAAPFIDGFSTGVLFVYGTGSCMVSESQATSTNSIL
jgi:hypothetical protein